MSYAKFHNCDELLCDLKAEIISLELAFQEMHKTAAAFNELKNKENLEIKKKIVEFTDDLNKISRHLFKKYKKYKRLTSCGAKLTPQK